MYDSHSNYHISLLAISYNCRQINSGGIFWSVSDPQLLYQHHSKQLTTIRTTMFNIIWGRFLPFLASLLGFYRRYILLTNSWQPIYFYAALYICFAWLWSPPTSHTTTGYVMQYAWLLRIYHAQPAGTAKIVNRPVWALYAVASRVAAWCQRKRAIIAHHTQPPARPHSAKAKQAKINFFGRYEIYMHLYM